MGGEGSVRISGVAPVVPEMTPVLVCGGRDFTDRRSVDTVLGTLRAGWPDLLIIHGGARGVDTLAEEWAQLHSVPTKVFRADWARHGRAAGPIRNREMLERGKPGFVVAFPGGAGTANMVALALEAKINVLEVCE